MQLPAVHHPQHNVCFFRLDGEGFLVPLTAAPQELARLFDVERPLLEQLNQQDGAQLTQLRQQRAANRLALTIQDRRWQCHFAPVDEQHWLVSAYLEQHQQQDELGLIEWQLQQNRPSSANLAARIPTLIDSLIQQQGGDRVIIWRHYAHEELLRPLYSQGLSFNLQPVKAERRYLRTLLNRGGLSYSHCTQQPLLSAFYYLATDGIQHRLDVPIILNGKLAGILSVEYQQSRPPVTAADMQFVAAIATELAESINEMVPAPASVIPSPPLAPAPLTSIPAPVSPSLADNLAAELFGEQLQEQQRLEQLAYIDPLTGLYNRHYLVDQLSKKSTLTTSTMAYGALLLLDINEVTTINNTLGTALAEQLLVGIAQRLEHFAKQLADTSLAYIGNHQLVLLCPHLGHTYGQTKIQAEQLARRINELFLEPLAPDSLSITVKLSIGIRLLSFAKPGLELDKHLQQAAMALLFAKQMAPGSYVFFSQEMADETQERARITHALQQALANQELQLYFQPQQRVSDNQPLGVEVVLRWQPEGLDFISPQVFIPIAETTSLICELGDWLLQQVCQRFQHWHDNQVAPVAITVNISARHFYSAHFVAKLAQLLQIFPACREHLVIGVTEELLQEQLSDSRQRITQINALGVKLAINNFGSGYPSVAYLRELPISALKINSSFIQHLDTHTQDRAILSCLLTLTKQLQMTVIVEGVTTEQQRQILKELNCPAYQGDLYAEPMPEIELLSWLRSMV